MKRRAKNQIGWCDYIDDAGHRTSKPLFRDEAMSAQSPCSEEDVRHWKLKNGWTEEDLKREAEENERMAREWAEIEKRRKGKGRKAA